MLDRRTFNLSFGAGLGLLAAPSVLRAQGDSIRIGALNPVSGSGAPYGSGMQQMIIAGAEAINEAGGIGGRQVRVYAEDTQSNPQTAVLAAKKLIDVNRVQAILGTWSSGVSLAVIPLTNAAGIPLMSTSGAPALSEPEANAKGLGFRFEATSHRYGRAFAEVVRREGLAKPAGMAFNNASGVGNVDGFRSAWEGTGGTMTGTVIYEPSQPSYRSELMTVLADLPDVVITGSYLADTTIILREWSQMGLAVKWILPGWAVSQDLIDGVGAAAMEGIYVVASVSNYDSPAYGVFKRAWSKHFDSEQPTNGFPPETWDMMISYGLAAEAAGSSEGAAVAAKMREVCNAPGTAVHSFAEGKEKLAAGEAINYEGASSVLEFDEKGDAQPNFSVSVIRDGTLEPLYIVEV